MEGVKSRSFVNSRNSWIFGFGAKGRPSELVEEAIDSLDDAGVMVIIDTGGGGRGEFPWSIMVAPDKVLKAVNCEIWRSLSIEVGFCGYNIRSDLAPESTNSSSGKR